MINAGVNFGNNLNAENEDKRLIQMTIDLQRGWTDKTRSLRDRLFTEVEGFKHPYTSRFISGWEENGPLNKICTVRPPLSWARRCYGSIDFRTVVKYVGEWFYYCDDKTVFDRIGREWDLCYKPVLDMDCPVVFFGEEDFEDQLAKAFEMIGLTYKGGFKKSKIHHHYDDTLIPDTAKETWNGLRRKHLTKR